MIDLYLIRTSYLEDGTIGQMLNRRGEPLCATVEREWADNQVNKSCIPPGIYRIKPDMRHPNSEKRILVWELQDVPGRSQIQIHIANKPSQLLGCIAPATSLTMFGKGIFGSNSGEAFKRLMDYMGNKQEGSLVVRDQSMSMQRVEYEDKENNKEA